MNFLLRMLGLKTGADVDRVVEGSWRVSHDLPPTVLYTVVGIGLVLAFINFLPWISMRLSVRIWTCLLRLAMLALLLVVLERVEWHVGLDLNQRQNWTVLVDDSASMSTRDVDGQSRYAAALNDLRQTQSGLNGKVNLSIDTFSGTPLSAETLNSNSKDVEPGKGPTSFRDAISRAALSRSKVDRLLILTDGRDSEGRDLQRLGEDLKSRDIALGGRLYGSKTPPRDLGISAEPERNIVRLGEELIVRGSINGQTADAAQDSGVERTITVKENGKEIKTITVPPTANGRFEVRHRPKNKGQHIYTLDLPGSDSVAQNNSTSFTVQVLEEKINVLLIEGFPRFEFKLIKGVLEVDPLVNLVSVCYLPGGGVYVQGTPLHRNPEQGLISSQADLFKYDVVILRDVSRSYFRAGGDTGESRLRNLVEFVTKRGGGLVVLAGQDVYRAGGYEDSHLAEVLPFDLSNQISGEPQFEGLFYAHIPKSAYDHPLLRMLPDPAENRQRLESLPQLDGSNNVGRFKPLATPLLTRTVKVKGKGTELVEKETPILAYMAVGEGKVLAAAVDTLWRWQLQPEFEDPPLTMLLANMVRYLAPPPGKKPETPNVAIGDGTPQVGQDLILSTTLKDAHFDPIRNAELVVTVTKPDAGSYRIYPRDLPEEPGHYEYRVALDQPGPYKVTSKFGKQETSREFLAGASAGEYADLSADREGIDRLLNAAGGELADGDVNTWLKSLDASPSQLRAARDLEVWNSPLVLVLFLLLVSVDCYIRKRQGLA